MNSLFEISNLTLYNGDTKVYNNLNLRIERGQHTAIIGANGSGKSTLLKLLSGELYPVADGTHQLHLLGRERWAKSELREHMGLVSHDLQSHTMHGAPGINVVLSGYFDSDSIWQHHQVSSQQLQTAIALMQELGIEHLRRRTYGSLSTGQQRRLLLARAMIKHPDVMLFDEPTTGLDMQGCQQALAIMQQMMTDGVSLILVTHHLYEIMPQIERVILLKEGTILADGPKAEVLTDANISHCFGTPLKVIANNGHYQAIADY
ncbi:MAG: ATP-binding cassette domain-containing protein [Porticoccaceae bacterium]|nr:ATP-binding cassette domain-containing protein [Porticoccaceae bacterium]